MKEAVEELRSYFELGNNWDGEGAEPPRASAIKDAMRFLRIIHRHTDKVPTPCVHTHGSVALVWDASSGITWAELEFTGFGTIIYYMIIEGEKIKGITTFGSLNVPRLKDKQKTPAPDIRDLY